MSSTLILDGRIVASKTKNEVLNRAQNFFVKNQRKPKLVVVLVGDNQASHVYVRNKQKACLDVEINSDVIKFPHNATQEQVLSEILKLNEDESVDGILIQLPLPDQINRESLFKALNPYKDVDVLSIMSQGLVWSGYSNLFPCTPSGIVEILKYYKIAIAGKKVVVIGRSLIVGKPMAFLLDKLDATVTICHSKTANIEHYTQSADVVIVAAGKSEFFGKKYFSPQSVVIDVGIHGSGTGKLTGDCKREELLGFVSALTPVPGGVGPMTIAMLLKNTIQLAEQRIKS